MKKSIFHITIVMILLFSCKTTEQLIIENKHYNIIFLQFTEANIESANYNFYSEKNILITSLEHSRDFNPKFEHLLTLTKDLDTMRLKCTFPVYKNFYIRNVNFKKGDYIVKYNNSKNGLLNNSELVEIIGKDIKTPGSTQNILFQNLSITDSINGHTIKDIELSDIQFTIMDCADTKKVKLEPM
ncbi:MAG: hypothetical protein KGY51_00065 [Psychroflexus sp.]|nr:hypothetical protein [Psychroflexus sp.]